MKRVMLSWVVLVSSAALAGEVGLKQLLDAADKNNVDRRIMAEQVRKARADTEQTWSALAPTLMVQGTWTHNQFEVGMDLTSSTNLLMQSMQQLFVLKPGIPGVPTIPSQSLIISPLNQLDAIFRVDLPLVDTTRWMRIKAQGIAEESAVEKENLTRDVVKRQVVGGWYAYAAALALRDSAKRSAEVSVKQWELMEIRGKVGVVTELDMLRSRAEVERTKQVVADTNMLVNTTRRMLTTLAGLEPPELAALPADDLTDEAPLAELEPRIEGLPAIHAADKDAEAARTISESAKLVLVPTLTANFQERVTNATGFSGRSGSWTAGVGLVWRVDPQVFYMIKGQEAVTSTAALAAEKARNQAKDQLYNDRQKLDAARIKVEAAKAQVQAAQRAAQVAKDRYAVGAATQVDVIQAERDLFSAEVAQISARTDLAGARASMRISAGLPLGVE